MATCKDCLYDEICAIHNKDKHTHEKFDFFWCGLFKDKTRFVEVVRCEECRFASSTHSDTYGCPRRLKYEEMPPTHFCGYGERKITNETDN